MRTKAKVSLKSYVQSWELLGHPVLHYIDGLPLLLSSLSGLGWCDFACLFFAVNRNHFVNPESLGDLAIRIRLTALMSNMSREATDALIRATTAAPTEEKIVPRVIVKRRASRKPLSGRKPIQQQGSPQQPKGSPGLFWTGSQGLSQRLTVGGSTGTLNVGQPMGNTSLFDSATIRGAYHRGKTDLCDETTTGDSVFLNRSHEYQHEVKVKGLVFVSKSMFCHWVSSWVFNLHWTIARHVQ